MELGVQAKVRNCIRGVRTQWYLVSRKLNRSRCVRVLVKGCVDSSSCVLGALSLCLVLVFFNLLVFSPYLIFTSSLCKLTQWSTSSLHVQAIGFYVFVGSAGFLVICYKLFMNHPQLSNIENIERLKIESIPSFFQICVYYAFWLFCSIIGSLLTFEFLVASYSMFVSIRGVFVLISHFRMSLLWILIPLLSFCAITFLFSVVLRVVLRRRQTR